MKRRELRSITWRIDDGKNFEAPLRMILPYHRDGVARNASPLFTCSLSCLTSKSVRILPYQPLWSLALSDLSLFASRIRLTESSTQHHGTIKRTSLLDLHTLSSLWLSRERERVCDVRDPESFAQCWSTTRWNRWVRRGDRNKSAHP